ncbi:S8 family peptidase [Actinokineospora spheciospongiae]|uniref:S8 family peptidase n=1 Tax=Actinokineospora spheciospongiae TaxID=909613 RepID=UPI000D710FF1|nr:S8 family peptidase [Actinokineospora spheciospongiae]PWW54298.1 subtilisin family serine protease [Actinokineospora spheciospongiae]
MKTTRTRRPLLAVAALVLLGAATTALPAHGTAARETAADYVVTPARGPGYTARLTPSAAAALAADPAVAAVEPDGTVHALADQPNPPNWGLDRIDQPALPLNANYHYETTAANVRAYIVDTGVSAHPDYAGRLLPGHDATGSGSTADGNGHGTFLAGIVGGTAHGVAKQVRIVPVKVLNASGSGTTAQVVAGLDWIAANAVKPAVVNMSIGGGPSTAIDAAVRRVIASGVTVSVAAGGSAANAANYSPSRVTEALVSGSLTTTDCRASNSNYGPTVDVHAPGQNIRGPWPGGGTNTLSGSSISSAFTAGAAALRVAVNPTWTAAQVHAAVVGTAVPTPCPFPTGTPNLILHTGPFGG